MFCRNASEERKGERWGNLTSSFRGLEGIAVSQLNKQLKPYAECVHNIGTTDHVMWQVLRETHKPVCCAWQTQRAMRQLGYVDCIAELRRAQLSISRIRTLRDLPSPPPYNSLSRVGKVISARRNGSSMSLRSAAAALRSAPVWRASDPGHVK